MSRFYTEAEVNELRTGEPPQPKTNLSDIRSAIAEFEALLPDWWWSVCVCSLTRDASCGPEINGRDARLLKDPVFDSGFHAELGKGFSLGDALRDVMEQGLLAREEALKNGYACAPGSKAISA